MTFNQQIQQPLQHSYRHRLLVHGLAQSVPSDPAGCPAWRRGRPVRIVPRAAERVTSTGVGSVPLRLPAETDLGERDGR
jgi:hypothetical protein